MAAIFLKCYLAGSHVFQSIPPFRTSNLSVFPQQDIRVSRRYISGSMLFDFLSCGSGDIFSLNFAYQHINFHWQNAYVFPPLVFVQETCWYRTSQTILFAIPSSSLSVLISCPREFVLVNHFGLSVSRQQPWSLTSSYQERASWHVFISFIQR